MTPSETVILTRYVKALCPQQAIDEYTPDAWHDVLGGLTLTQARTAAANVASKQPFVAPSEILAEAERRYRAELGRRRLAALADGRPLLLAANGTVVVGSPAVAPPEENP